MRDGVVDVGDEAVRFRQVGVVVDVPVAVIHRLVLVVVYVFGVSRRFFRVLVHAGSDEQRMALLYGVFVQVGMLGDDPRLGKAARRGVVDVAVAVVVPHVPKVPVVQVCTVDVHVGVVPDLNNQTFRVSLRKV